MYLATRVQHWSSTQTRSVDSRTGCWGKL